MTQFDALVDRLRTARSLILSTHRHADGDGLGAQIALYYALRKIGKDVRVVNVDTPARKYDFLSGPIEVFSESGGMASTDQTADPSSKLAADLAIVFDTNDRRLVEPLISHLEKRCKEVVFVDHHPILEQGPSPSTGSWIDTTAASTGELTHRLIRALGIELDREIARALYTSVVFDTQLFRYVKSDPKSHLLAAELLRFERAPEEVHQRLFATYTVQKMAFLGRALSQIEYFAGDRLAFVVISPEDFKRSGLERDESGDVIDLVMNVGTIEAAALAREDGPGRYKLSFRSKGRVPVLPLAESFGGGGHPFAAGATVTASLETLRSKTVSVFESLLPLRESRK